MKRFKRLPWKRIAYVAIGVLAVYLIVGIILAGHDLPPMPPGQVGISLAGGHVRGNRITTKSWSFDYTTAHLSADGTTGVVNGVKHGIIYKKGKPHLLVSAESIALDTQMLNFTATGKVHVELIGDPAHRSFDTDLITWTNATKILSMPHPSYLHSGHQTLKIEDVTINFKTDQIHISRIVGGVALPSP